MITIVKDPSALTVYETREIKAQTMSEKLETFRVQWYGHNPMEEKQRHSCSSIKSDNTNQGHYREKIYKRNDKKNGQGRKRIKVTSQDKQPLWKCQMDDRAMKECWCNWCNWQSSAKYQMTDWAECVNTQTATMIMLHHQLLKVQTSLSVSSRKVV